MFASAKCEIIGSQGKEAQRVRLCGEKVIKTASFKYLGVPFNDKGVNVAELCTEDTMRAVKIAILSPQWDATVRGLHIQ